VLLIFQLAKMTSSASPHLHWELCKMVLEFERHRIKQWLQHQKDIQAIACILFLCPISSHKRKAICL
ncbi:MAG: hypothetical protein WBE61_01990, partial [Nitrososphaeraceae archaeon]